MFTPHTPLMNPRFATLYPDELPSNHPKNAPRGILCPVYGFFKILLCIGFIILIIFCASHSASSHQIASRLPGILNMVLAAYQQALNFGFTEPASCRKAKDEWRLEADQVVQLVDDTCSRVPSGEIQSQRLYDTFAQRAQDQDIGQKVKQKSFIDRLTRLGYGKRRDSQCKYITGLE
jgi:hypothetical protein